MIKAFKDLFNNGIPTDHLYKTHYNVWDNIAEVYTKSNWNVKSYLHAYKACKKAQWKASQINEIGTDIDGNPFVRVRVPWQRGTRTKIQSGMIHGEPMTWEIEEPINEDNIVTYTKLLS
tara:strand:- start:741 stop:1097 length:357 start_codon:yes stop_codon:yes gene_type:complete